MDENPTPETQAGAGPVETLVRPRFFEVQVSSIVVIQADDESEAYEAARDLKRDIFGDCWEPDVEVRRPIESLADLRHGWDGECIPYNGDGATRLKAML